jgi:hypothetical protein
MVWHAGQEDDALLDTKKATYKFGDSSCSSKDRICFFILDEPALNKAKSNAPLLGFYT